jgi:hypothetical protein
MRRIESIAELPLGAGGIVRYADGGWRLYIKLLHTRWHRWYLVLPPQAGLVECAAGEDEDYAQD